MLILIKILLVFFYDTLILNCDCEDANCSSDGSLVQYIYGKQTYGSLVDGCLDRLACWPRPARP